MVEHVDGAGAEVRRVNKVTIDFGAEGDGLVDGAEPGFRRFRVVGSEDRLVWVSPLVQAEIVPFSVTKIKDAGRLVPGTRNAVAGLVVGFLMMPVGAAGVGVGGAFGLTGLQSVAGTTLPGSGIDTCSGTLVPSPS